MGSHDVIPVLLDTDIGTNVDDALALTYLLRQPRCELAGITTVTVDVNKRAACAEVVCRAAGRPDVLIHCGCSDPLPPGPGQPGVPLYDAIRDYAHRLDRPAHTAIDFLRQSIRARPGEITLLTIGPLTNVAILFALDPEIPSLVAGMVSMAGVYFPHPRAVETNCRVDPIAAAVVFAARVPRHVCVGLDVTSRCALPADEGLRKIEAFRIAPLTAMAAHWAAGRSAIAFHDPLAAAVVFHPRLCRHAGGRVHVALDAAGQPPGRTTFSPATAGPGPTHRIATDVDVAAFFAEFFSTLGK
jgi:purine nucleosidase